MSKKILCLAVYAIAVAGGRTIRPGKSVLLAQEQAERLLGKGAVTLAPEAEASEDTTGDLMLLPDAEFNQAVTSMNVADLKAAVQGMALDAGDAKTKANFIAVIKAAREKAAQLPVA
jgi:hypothetical protein